MPLRGKFLRREGTLLYFGSKNKPEWRPMEAFGNYDYTQLIEGSYYELEVDGNRLTSFRKLPEPSGGPNRQPAPRPQGRGDVVSRDSLMASATGFAKSAMEGGLVKTWIEAMEAGLAWAGKWGPAPSMESSSPSVPRTPPFTDRHPPPQEDEYDRPIPGWDS